MADSVEQLYKAQDLQEKLYPITKENAVKDNNNVSLDTKLTSINTSISNKLEAVKINNTALPITDKAVNITIDSAVSETSTNAVQNNVIKSYVDTAKEDISNSVLENLTSGSSLKLYAQETLADQEFLYRKNPTEGDGYAKITSIKGNTLVWNQIYNVNSDRTALGVNIKVVNGAVSITGTSTDVRTGPTFAWTDFKGVIGHKYIITKDFVLPSGDYIFDQYNLNSSTDITTVVFTLTNNDGYIIPQLRIAQSGVTYNINGHLCVFDLTKMFGAGNEPTTVEEFTSLFPKPYYDYCQGAMLSFGGRNVKFNQLVQNGNFADTSVWTKGNCTFNVSNNVLTFKATAQYGNTYNTINNVANHVCLLLFEAKSYTNTGTVFYFRQQKTATSYTNVQQTLTNAWVKYNIRVKCDSDTIYMRPLLQDNNSSGWGDIQLKNVMVIDLTEMFGAGNEPSAEGFLELFPNDYYEYTTEQYMNLGQPVSLKTVSKNQFNTQIVSPSTTVGTTLTKGDGSIRLQYTGTGRYTGFNFMNPNGGLVSDWANKLLLKKKYRLSFDFGGAEVAWTCGLRTASANSFVGSITMQNQGHYSLTLNLDTVTEDVYISWARTGNSTNSFDVTVSNIQLELGTTETDYEPFKESTTSIPLDEFPNGMDGINDIHDEKNETEYVKRFATIKVNTVASGSLRNNGDYYAAVNGVTNAKPADNGTVANMICNICETMSAGARYNSTKDAVCARTNGSIELCISGITSRADLQTYVDSHDIYITYELATPLENYGVVDLGSLAWTYSSQGFFLATINDIVQGMSSSTVNPNVISDMYVYKGASGWTSMPNMSYGFNNTEIRIKNTAYNTADAFKSAMSGVYLLYEKANPQGFTNAEMKYSSYADGTEQILPENVSIPTTAPIIADIEYSYDFKAVDRIIGMLNSVAQNETSPSTHNYSVGDYLVYNYQLYKVIASISTGASLTVGTNIQATTIMNELASLS